MNRPLRLVLDTNVVVSALLWEGNPGQIIVLAEAGEVRLYTSRFLLDELRVTLERPKLRKRAEMTGVSAAAIFADYCRLATVKKAAATQSWSRDPDDDHVIACALATRADFLVTGDDDLLMLGAVEALRIVSPVDLLNMLA